MKRIIISIFILCLLAAISFYSVYAAGRFSNDLIDKIERAESAFEEKRFEEAARVAKEICGDWNEFMELSVLINDLGQASEITSALCEMYSFAQEGEISFYAACDKAEAQLLLLKNMQTPTLWRIL